MEKNNISIFPNIKRGTRIAWLLPSVTALPCYIVFLFASELHLSEESRLIAMLLFILHFILVFFQVPASIYWAFSVFSVHRRLKELTAGQYPIGPVKALLSVLSPAPVTVFCAILVVLSRAFFEMLMSRLLHVSSFHEETLEYALKCAIFATGMIPVWLCAFVGWQQWRVLQNLRRYGGLEKPKSLSTILISLIAVVPSVALVASLDFSQSTSFALAVYLPLVVILWFSGFILRSVFAKTLLPISARSSQLAPSDTRQA